MVKFGKNYSSQIVRHWREHYIQYDALKDALESEAAAAERTQSILSVNSVLSTTFSVKSKSSTKSSTDQPSSKLSTPAANDDHSAPLLPLTDPNSRDGSRDERDFSFVTHHCATFPEFTSTLLQLNPKATFYPLLDSEISRCEAAYAALTASIFSESTEVCAITVSKFKTKKLVQRCYHDLMRLESFRSLNLTAISKILKKANTKFRHLHPIIVSPAASPSPSITVTSHSPPIYEHTPSSNFSKHLLSLLADSSIYTSKNLIEEKKQDLVKKYAYHCTDDDLTLAETHLCYPKQPKSASSLFRLAFRLGIALSFTLWVLWDVFIDESHGYNLFRDPVSNVFTASFSYTLLVFLYGLCCLSWEKFNVNHNYVLSFPLKTTSVGRNVVSHGLVMYCVTCGTLLMYYKIRRDEGGVLATTYNAKFLPVFLLAMLTYMMFFPRVKRRGILKSLGQTVIAPFGRVGFRENILGDFLTSLVKPNIALAYSGCYYVSGYYTYASVEPPADTADDTPTSFGACSAKGYSPLACIVSLITVMPLMWRLMQCMVRYNSTRERKHLFNAGKYFSAFTVVIFGVFNSNFSKKEDHDGDDDAFAHNVYRAVWIAVFIAATLYQFWWDIFMDWGLSVRDCRKLTFPKWVYVAFVPADLLLRFLWTLTLIPDDTDSDGLVTYDIMRTIAPFLAISEVCRRLGWCLLRVENEFINNADSFSRIDFVPLQGEEGDSKEEEEEKEEGRNIKTLVWELAVVGAAVCVISSLAYLAPH